VSTPESRPDFLAVTKQSAARSQLETAIRLWFYEGDPVAIHTLAVAAHDCLHAPCLETVKELIYTILAWPEPSDSDRNQLLTLVFGPVDFDALSIGESESCHPAGQNSRDCQSESHDPSN
jgi:hypothetical protein